MLHHVYQLASTCVCLLLDAEQVAHGGVLELFLWKQVDAAAENDAMRAVRVHQKKK